MVPAYLYEQLCGELLIDPVQVSKEIAALLEDIRRASSAPTDEHDTTQMPATLPPPPPVRKEATT